jgi:hypothetical protein
VGFFFQRKKTLLQEYRIKDKSNRFLDRRIGEKNSAMTAEDRIMARFTVERMKMHNKVIIYMYSSFFLKGFNQWYVIFHQTENKYVLCSHILYECFDYYFHIFMLRIF